MRDLGLLAFLPCRSDPTVDCGSGSASSINESGQVVGWSTAADGSYHVVLWENGTIRDLWTVHAGATSVINDAGQVAASAGGEAVFWDGTGHLIGSLGGGGTVVVDMNEAGTVVGTSKTGSGEQHVYVWTQASGMVDLGTGPHGFPAAWVVGISFDGDIVGYTGACDSRYSGICLPTETRAVMWRYTRGRP
jgi:probable HAF family extracellular repeat protein